MSAGTVLPPVPTKAARVHDSLSRPWDPAHTAGKFSSASQNPQSWLQGIERIMAFVNLYFFIYDVLTDGFLFFVFVQAVDFLSQVLDSPEKQAVRDAVRNLQDIGEWLTLTYLLDCVRF